MFMKGWSPANSVPNSLVGTPANVENKKSEPPATEQELQEKIQFMINLQKAANEQTYPNVSEPADRKQAPVVPETVEGAYITPAAAAEAAAAARATGGIFPHVQPMASHRLHPNHHRHPNHRLPPPLPQKGRSIMGSIPYQDYASTDVHSKCGQYGGCRSRAHVLSW